MKASFDYTPIVRNIFIKNIKSAKSRYAIYVEGYERSPVTNFHIENCEFSGVTGENRLHYFLDLKMKNVFINGENISCAN